jgi:hypothetical protein
VLRAEDATPVSRLESSTPSAATKHAITRCLRTCDTVPVRRANIPSVDYPAGSFSRNFSPIEASRQGLRTMRQWWRSKSAGQGSGKRCRYERASMITLANDGRCASAR